MPLLELFFFFFSWLYEIRGQVNRFSCRSSNSHVCMFFFFLISLVHSLPFCSATLHALAKKYAAAALYTHTHRHS